MAETSVPERVVIFGSTGSIGQSTLDIIASHPEKYDVWALTAHQSIDALAAQCQRFSPRYAAVADERLAKPLADLLKQHGSRTEVLTGPAVFEQLASASDVDTVVAAIVGAAGLPSTMAAVESGKKVLLANKEALVVAGSLFMQAVQQSGATLLPIDSEHNAIFQCLPWQEFARGPRASLQELGVSRILLTGSGGPFRTWKAADLNKVTPEQACAHPNWSMGRKISVDSATMMNKGLEFIEACWLFDSDPDQIEVVIHPQSIVHSMVEYSDGSVLAQLGSPDMRTPIAHALAWPQRIHTDVQRLDWTQMSTLEFETPDRDKFPALRLAEQVARQHSTAAVALNAANEVAVDTFFAGRIAFTDIVRIAQHCVEELPHQEPESIEQLQVIDTEVREYAATVASKLCHAS